MQAQAKLGAILALALLSVAHAGDEPPRHSQPNERATLDGRVAIYARALNLDAIQQARLRTLLILQRDQVRRIWNDTDLTAATRVFATRQVGDSTADNIRAMLTAEQRKKYNPPRPASDGNTRSDTTSVEGWMSRMSK